MARVLVFDSGVGGLSISEAILASDLNHQIIFASDNEAFPYGNKPIPELISRVCEVLQNLLSHNEIDVLVIACNTASTVALPVLRERFPIEIVGVVPAIKPAALLSKNKQIGLLATPATVKRRYTKELIETFAADCHVDMIGSSELVKLAEQKLHIGYCDQSIIERVIQPWLGSDCEIDTVVLACTHFPFLKEEFNKIFHSYCKSVQWVDSSKGIANRVDYLSKQFSEKSKCDPAKQSTHKAIFTKEENFSTHFQDNLLKNNILDYSFLN